MSTSSQVPIDMLKQQVEMLYERVERLELALAALTTYFEYKSSINDDVDRNTEARIAMQLRQLAEH